MRRLARLALLLTLPCTGSAWAFEISLAAMPGLTVNRAASEQISFTVQAQDGRALQSVRFYVDDVLKLTDSAAPYQYAWVAGPGEATGNHTLRVEATDTSGNLGVETRPLYVVSSPCNVIANAASVVRGEPLTVHGICTTTATVERVEFLLDGTPQHADAASAYTWTVDTSALAAGTRTIGIRGHLAGGVQADHATTVQVADAPLNVTLTPGPVVSRGEQLTFAAAAADGRTFSQVSFYFDGQFRGGESAAPYEYRWQGNDPWGKPDPFGRHTLFVEALDTNGVTLTATREVFLLTKTCNILVGSNRYRVGSHDKVYLGPHTYRQGERITLEGLCSGSAAVQSVEFYLDGALVQTDSAGPYLWTLNTAGLALGSHTVSMKARLGGTTESNHAATIEIVAP